MNEPDNPPAFPSLETHPSYDFPVHHFGMTLRDWFAGQALAGFCAAPDVQNPNSVGISRLSYVYADAMLVERAKVRP